jgi:3-methyladenine DNA glycosylase/8-oxoguanine DNA glycosylase
MRRRSQVVRQRSAKPSPAGSIPAVASNFTLPPNFAFRQTVESHGWYRLAPFQWSADEGVLRRKEALPEGVVELEIRQRGKLLHVDGAKPSEELTRRITRMLQLDVDTSEFAEMARSSERHAWVAETGFGRLLCGTTVWEDAVKIIATTNTTWAQTVRMIEKLVAKCGRDGAFPTPRDVLRFSEEELQTDCRLGYRAKSMRALASGIDSGAIDLQALGDRTLPTQALFKNYQTLPGIGPYGAAHLLAMDGRHDFIAVDSEFRRFVRDTYHRGKKISDAAMLKRYNRWGRWKYLAYWSELWNSVAERLQPVARQKRARSKPRVPAQ